MSLRARSLAPVLASAASLFFTVVACSSSSGGSGGGVCEQYFDALVSQSDRCSTFSTGRDLTNARARFATVCANALAAPGAQNFGSQLSACLQALSGSCDDTPDACKGYTGTLDDDAACQEDYQCKSGFCKRPNDASCGTCAAVAAIGQPCDDSSSRSCVSGATCVSTGSGNTGKCYEEKTSKAGEPCGGATDGVVYRCDDGLACDHSGSGMPTCKARGAAGDACRSRSDCNTGLICNDGKCRAPLADGAACTYDECGKGLGCDSTTNKCVKQVTVTLGEACDLTHTCGTGVCEGLGASSNGTTKTITPGKCVAPLADGAVCTDDGPPCDTFASCKAGKCTLPDPSQCK